MCHIEWIFDPFIMALSPFIISIGTPSVTTGAGAVRKPERCFIGHLVRKHEAIKHLKTLVASLQLNGLTGSSSSSKLLASSAEQAPALVCNNMQSILL